VPRLPPDFFGRDATLVAPDLLGAELRVIGLDGRARRGLISEVEAYTSDDPASHSFRGRTARNEVMFGPPGRWYVYLIYGVHWCMNVVTGDDGDGQAVLIRATLDVSGPGRLTKALHVDRSFDGAPAGIAARRVAVEPAEVVIGPRVGITKATDWPRRWLWVPTVGGSSATSSRAGDTLPGGGRRVRRCAT
jgi:DNA-3-methyladenine glycosylase